MRKYSLTVRYRLRFATVNPRGSAAGWRPQALIVFEGSLERAPLETGRVRVTV